MESVPKVVIACIFILSFSSKVVKCLTSEEMAYTYSSHSIQKLALHEQKVLSAMLTYLKKLNARLKVIDLYLNETEKNIFHYSNAIVKIGNYKLLDSEILQTEISSHPLKSYRILLRFANEQGVIMSRIGDKADQEFKTELKKLNDELPFPNQRDVESALTNLVRLRQTYNLSSQDVIEGRLGEIETYSGLALRDITALGTHAMESEYFTQSIDYLSVAFKIASDKKDPQMIEQIRTKINTAIKKHNVKLLNKKFKKPVNPFHYQNPIAEFGTPEFDKRIPQDIYKFIKENTKPGSGKSELFLTQLTFEKLCQGFDIRSPKETKVLICKLGVPNPYFTIHPLKIEYKNMNPDILQVYEVFSDKQIDTIRKEAEPSLKRSLVVGGEDDSSGQVDNGRTSTNSWIEDYHPWNPFHFVSTKVGLITGLKVIPEWATEQMQVACYIPGGQYAPHYDADESIEHLATLFDDILIKGDRIATFMVYLSDVEAGGGTAFPKLGFATQPIKGSAIFWYNLKPDGSLDKFTLHGGCPVLHGIKFIANKWIRYNEQVFIKKCNLQPDTLLYNKSST